jgi:hypothetical protein
MPTVTATITNVARKYWPQMFGQLLGAGTNSPAPGTFPWNPVIQTFRVGEGGWIGTAQVPRTPDPTLIDLDIIQNPTRYAGYSAADYWENQLTSANTTFIAPTSIQISCLLDFGQFNQDFDSPPHVPAVIWELGLYSIAPPLVAPGDVALVTQNRGTSTTQLIMLAYGTFQGQSKTSNIQLENQFTISF